mgnify:CR=1 FL=1
MPQSTSIPLSTVRHSLNISLPSYTQRVAYRLHPRFEQNLSSTLITILLALFVVSSNTAWALTSDRDQPADIEADDIEFDMKKGTRIFTNNVLVVQGTLRIKADKLEARYADGELQNVKAWGNFARFKQRPDDKPNDVEGWANKIVVNQKTNMLTLTGQAALRQGGDTARGDEIIYNMSTDTLKVRGGAAVGVSNDPNSTVKADPNKKLEDPFKSPPPSADKLPESAISATKKAQQEASDEVSAPEPTRSGRSRLIIQPKKIEGGESDKKRGNGAKKGKKKKLKGESVDESNVDTSDESDEQDASEES